MILAIVMSRPGEVPIRPEDLQTIVCLYCAKQQEVGRRAMTITCKFCHKPLKLEDLTFKGYEARRAIDTCGIVVIEKKGQVISERLLCGGLVARGRVKGNIISRGPVLVGPEAEIRGDVVAPTLAVGAGAVLHGHYRIGYPEVDDKPTSQTMTGAAPAGAPSTSIISDA
jgi:cytoskeletal protein CcmA (bactofilin family)